MLPGRLQRKRRSSSLAARAALAIGLCLVAFGSASGSSFLGWHWGTPTIQMRVQTGASDVVLADGSVSWDAVMTNALALWNEQMRDSQFVWTVVGPGSPVSFGDRVNSMQLASTIYGDSFGDSVLAVTLTDQSGGNTLETDVIFNTHNTFNSYRESAYAAGTIGSFDIHRIAVHELGHVIGLDHPDDNGQTVDAIMNARVSLLDQLQTDDINGAAALYGAPPGAPAPTGRGRLAQISTRGDVGVGDNVMIGGFIIPGATAKKVIVRAIGPSLGMSGVTATLADPVLELHDGTGATIFSNDDWRGAQEQEIIDTTVPPTNDREAAIVADLPPGGYTAVISGANGGTGVALVEVYDLAPESGELANISTRTRVGVGDSVLIGGFIVLGPQSQKLIVRALGPSLGENGVADALINPTLDVYNGNGVLFRSNDNYSSSVNDSTISSYGLRPPKYYESALYFESAPGNYTAIVRGLGNSTGVALMEVYAVE